VVANRRCLVHQSEIQAGVSHDVSFSHAYTTIITPHHCFCVSIFMVLPSSPTGSGLHCERLRLGGQRCAFALRTERRECSLRLGSFMGGQLSIQQDASHGESEVLLSPRRRTHRGVRRVGSDCVLGDMGGTIAKAPVSGEGSTPWLGWDNQRVVVKCGLPLRPAMGETNGDTNGGAQGFCCSACLGP